MCVADAKQCLFRTKHDERKSDDPDVAPHSNRRTDAADKIIGLVSTLILVLPVVIFYVLKINGVSGGVRLAALLAFMVASITALLTMTNVTRQEVFGAFVA